jgi:hypothetical protein
MEAGRRFRASYNLLSFGPTASRNEVEITFRWLERTCIVIYGP